jgi:hypothetical protein
MTRAKSYIGGGVCLPDLGDAGQDRLGKAEPNVQIGLKLREIALERIVGPNGARLSVGLLADMDGWVRLEKRNLARRSFDWTEMKVVALLRFVSLIRPSRSY